MDMKVIYKILGKDDQHILSSQVSNLHDICEEIIDFANHNQINKLAYYSYAPGRMRGIFQVIDDLYQRFTKSAKTEVNSGNNIDDIKCFSQLFAEFRSLVKELDDIKFLTDDNNKVLLAAKNLNNFFIENKFDIEDIQ